MTLGMKLYICPNGFQKNFIHGFMDFQLQQSYSYEVVGKA